MRYSFFLIPLFISIASFAQSGKSIEIITPTEKRKVISLKDLESYPKHTVDSVQITNHLKVYRSTLKNIKGVLLKDVLSKIPFGEKSPKLLSEYYIICIAEDNYKVVFSWNELFNTSIGERVLIVPEIEGRPKDGIVILAPNDYATGRRYVKMLHSIIIKRVE